jgi:hypothetical protein
LSQQEYHRHQQQILGRSFELSRDGVKMAGSSTALDQIGNCRLRDADATRQFGLRQSEGFNAFEDAVAKIRHTRTL